MLSQQRTAISAMQLEFSGLIRSSRRVFWSRLGKSRQVFIFSSMHSICFSEVLFFIFLKVFKVWVLIRWSAPYRRMMGPLFPTLDLGSSMIMLVGQWKEGSDTILRWSRSRYMLKILELEASMVVFSFLFLIRTGILLLKHSNFSYEKSSMDVFKPLFTFLLESKNCWSSSMKFKNSNIVAKLLGWFDLDEPWP